MKWHRIAALLLVSTTAALHAQDPSASPGKAIPKGAKLFISTVDGGFDSYLSAGIMKKEVPVTVVTVREKADFELTGIAESEKAGWAKMLFAGSTASREQAGIKVTNLKTGEVVYAYAVHKGNSARGKQSAAEACAKHLKEKIEGQK